jgi:hypothetical protein
MLSLHMNGSPDGILLLHPAFAFLMAFLTAYCSGAAAAAYSCQHGRWPTQPRIKQL